MLLLVPSGRKGESKSKQHLSPTIRIVVQHQNRFRGIPFISPLSPFQHLIYNEMFAGGPLSVSIPPGLLFDGCDWRRLWVAMVHSGEWENLHV